MASMKYYKQPSFGYGASQSNLSKYEHEDRHNMSQSSHVENGWAVKPNRGSSYYGQAEGSQMGQPNELGHSWAGESTHHRAQAQVVHPIPSMDVQQSQHMMESRKAQKWANDRAKFPGPIRANHSGGAIVSKVDQGWITKPNPVQTGRYGASMYDIQEANKYQYGTNGSTNSGWANKPTEFYSPKKFSSSAQANHSSAAMLSEEHMVGDMANGWANSPVAAIHSSQAMRQEDHGWAHSPTATNYSSQAMRQEDDGWTHSPVATNHSSQAMRQEDHGWAHSPFKANHSTQAIHQEDHGWAHSPVATNHSSQAMRQEDHGWTHSPVAVNQSSQVMRQENHGWAPSRTNPNHSNFAMRQEDHVVGKMDQGWGASPTRANLSSHTARNHELVVENLDNGWVGTPTKANHGLVASPITKTNHLSQSTMAQTGHVGWAGNPTNYSGQGWAVKHSNSNGPAHAAHTAYNHNECNEDEGVGDILDEILTKYPAHNLSNGHQSCAGKPNLDMGRSHANSSYTKQQEWAQLAQRRGRAESSYSYGECDD